MPNPKPIATMPSKPKPERVQFTISAEAAKDIRSLAALEYRTLRDQLRYILALGLGQAMRRSRMNMGGKS
jgi:hypothetical protein